MEPYTFTSTGRDKVRLVERQQEAHFNRIAVLYEQHYGDPSSQMYLEAHVYRPMFQGITICGIKGIDLMCGGGGASSYLSSRGAQMAGLDVSQEEIGLYKKHCPACEAICASIFDNNLESDCYDCAVSVGGLHHLQPRAADAIREIHRILKPGGWFCFSEPHAGSIPDLFRRLWYRRDPFFLPNEASIDFQDLKGKFSGLFDFEIERYSGNIAYLLVLQSMILRIPHHLKPLYTMPLLRIESSIKRLQGKLLSCFVVVRWRKK
jgi:SAM-dependent methyltransferase